MKKKSVIGYIIGILLMMVGVMGGFYGRKKIVQEQIAEKVLRFHVLANSNSEEDQKLKLQVRDAIGGLLQEKMAQVENREECEKFITEWIPKIEQTAAAVIEENGYDYSVCARLEETDFPVKTYGAYTFPAGRYEALRVTIGEGAGENWWCVLYPNMCFENSMYEVVDERGEKALREVLDEKEYEAVLKEGNYQIRLRILDFFGKKVGLAKS